MQRFAYVRAADPVAAVALVSADPQAHYLAGGTTELDLVLKDGVLDPERLVDITGLPLRLLSEHRRRCRRRRPQEVSHASFCFVPRR